MKRIRHFNFCFVTAIGLVASGAAQAQPDDDELFGPREPLHLYLTATVTDHVNLDVTEDRLRRILAMLDKYRKAHPDSGITATVFFNGAVSQALQDRNGQTHIVDLVKDFIQRGLIEAAYDGSDEPVYKQRPLLDLSPQKTPKADQRWKARMDVTEELLTEARDPLTGVLIPGKSGGLKKMQEVFGDAVCVAGITLLVPEVGTGSMAELGSDSETVHVIRKYNTNGIMIGLPEDNPMHAVTYRGWASDFSKAMSPAPPTSPELYWQEGVLRVSQYAQADNHLFRASSGPEAFQIVVGRLNRSKHRIVPVELGSARNYLTKAFTGEDVFPSVKYAYDHPDHPQLPAEARRSKADIDAAFAKEEGVLDWLFEEFLPYEAGNGFVSSSGLKKITRPGWGFDVSVAPLRSALGEALKAWGDQPNPPKFLKVDNQYLSLAEMFQVMADALAQQSRTGNLPTSVRVAAVHGPLEVISDATPVVGEVTATAVAQAAAAIAPALHDSAWKTLPLNAIPGRVNAGGLDLTAAQFLRLMAEALVAPSLQVRLQAKQTSPFWGRDAYYMRASRSLRDMGNTWTYKPAPLAGN
jgi:hypothetical protein